MSKRYDDRYGRGGYRRDRDYADDRGYMERAGDEVRSWFGDDEAERRREMDEQRDRGREPRYGSDWNRADWNRSNRGRQHSGRSDWNRSTYREAGSGFRGVGAAGERAYDTGSRGFESSRGSYQPAEFRDRTWSDSERSPEDWRNASSREPMRYQDYDQRWSSPDRGRDYDTNRYRDSEHYTGTAYRPASNWSVDEGRTEFGRQHWGRGPKGYQRSDNRILEDVCDRLTYSDVDAGDIEVRVESGEVTLSGFVRDRADKRRAEDVAEEVSGVREVHNNIRVSREDRGIGQSDTSATGQPGTVLGVNPTVGSNITNERPKAKS